MSLSAPLPLILAKTGTEWLRIHNRGQAPMWFGPKPGSPPIGRFDDPERQFRVCYLGASVEACFAETFLRTPPVRVVAIEDLRAKFVATLVTRRPLRLVRLYGHGLARIGVTAEVASGSSYDSSQAWARKIWEHADAPDGIAYRSRHDDSAICIALFDRAQKSVTPVSSIPLTSDSRALAQILSRYGLGLVS